MKAYFITEAGNEKNNHGSYLMKEEVGSLEAAKDMAIAGNFMCFMIKDDFGKVKIYNYDIDEARGDGWECVDSLEKVELDAFHIWNWIDRKFICGNVANNFPILEQIAFSWEEILELQPNFFDSSGVDEDASQN